MTTRSLPTRKLSGRPDLDQLKRQAKELLDAYRAGDPQAVAEVSSHYRDPQRATFALHDAQLVMARAYGFQSWPRLKAYVEGATDQRLVAAVRAGDLPEVRAMLHARPELAGRGAALHAAVLTRAPEMVRLLMQQGANARVGIYPHRDATSPLTIAAERGDAGIVDIIRDEEGRRQRVRSGAAGLGDELFRALQHGDEERARALMAADPSLVQARHPVFDATPLLVAARALSAGLVSWLLSHGANAMERGFAHPSDRSGQQAVADRDWTPLDAAAYSSAPIADGAERAERFAGVASLLLKAGAAMTAAAAVALGDSRFVRALHAEGALLNRIDEWGGLLRVAVSHARRDMLALLLDLGFDPDERTRFRDVSGDDAVFTWGMPLWNCAAAGKHDMAEMLLARGADPNASVYASGTPLNQAYGRRDRSMIELLERYGGRLDAGAIGLYRLSDRARQLIEADPGVQSDEDGRTVAEQLLWGAACGGDPDIVRMALEHVSWPRDDPRWFTILEQPLRIWNHGDGFWAHHEWDRRAYLTCFELVLSRCDPNIRGRESDGQPFGLTILHSVAGSREHLTAAERRAFATLLLDAGARLDIRDAVLESTPLGWACRWGRTELVELYLDRGADPGEPDTAPWATPLAWAMKKGHAAIEDRLRRAGAR